MDKSHGDSRLHGSGLVFYYGDVTSTLARERPLPGMGDATRTVGGIKSSSDFLGDPKHPATWTQQTKYIRQGLATRADLHRPFLRSRKVEAFQRPSAISKRRINEAVGRSRGEGPRVSTEHWGYDADSGSWRGERSVVEGGRGPYIPPLDIASLAPARKQRRRYGVQHSTAQHGTGRHMRALRSRVGSQDKPTACRKRCLRGRRVISILEGRYVYSCIQYQFKWGGYILAVLQYFTPVQ
ncbi:uncharacterized protein LY79DRAFT_272336 [Colletotrichum navitas]|uniref:Uncharacterized protein n=1 Tax=Colletotrichum navitas TaxID=681940 RepID=A0AAD8PVD7_9PEZI|nr:uncharacterized protein LY79DRAFT_272336 [Colletotrichum navitas]KAK1585365.1 hypothetical protein LY79DRAFT_272336 [Colletotrichum navitas]